MTDQWARLKWFGSLTYSFNQLESKKKHVRRPDGVRNEMTARLTKWYQMFLLILVEVILNAISGLTFF
jgi:hypothetical protein